MGKVVVYICSDSIQASFIKGHLENEGISAFFTEEDRYSNLVQHTSGIMNPGVKMYVDEENLEQAIEILKWNYPEDNE
jgi:predicted peroxiredoxin